MVLLQETAKSYLKLYLAKSIFKFNKNYKIIKIKYKIIKI